MKRSYPALVAVTLLAALGLGLLARAPRRPSPEGASASALAPEVAVALVVNGGAVSPTSALVPKGHRVRLSVVNQGPAPARVELAGYQDRLAIGTLAPGEAWSGEFVADRPGEDFAWLVDGQPAGRFTVVGSHLEEGHR